MPNGHTRVSRLIKSITSKDGAILSAITLIQGDNQKRNDFELAADFLLLTASAAKEIERSYRISALMTSGLNADTSKGNSKKNDGIGSTGVELRYYLRAEYVKLNGKQKSELHEWRKSKKSNSNSGDKMSAKISALETQLKELADMKNEMVATIAALSTTNTNNEAKNGNPPTNSLNQRNN